MAMEAVLVDDGWCGVPNSKRAPHRLCEMTAARNGGVAEFEMKIKRKRENLRTDSHINTNGTVEAMETNLSYLQWCNKENLFR